MNLAKLFEMQRQLDTHIEKEHPREQGEDRLAKKILALQVELGELANEWRGFKFWSHDQEPRYELYDEDEFSLLGDLFEQEYPLLEEYVDCLHFILSIGLELEITNIVIDSDYTHENPSVTFIELFGDVRELFDDYENDPHREIKRVTYERMFNRFIGLGEKHLGFTWGQIEEAYMKKNQENHRRQEVGY
jgi:dimeric dUTPase (all-alpha-NTP-PPase superfamily)